MSTLSRFSISVEDELIQSFDQLISDQGYNNRSEALRDLMREALIKSKLKELPEFSEVMGTLTFVYDHHASDVKIKMESLQHDYYRLIVSVLHVHINHDDCMEVIILRGEMQEIRSLAHSILSLKGIKYGKLFETLPAGEITGQVKPHESKNHKH